MDVRWSIAKEAQSTKLAIHVIITYDIQKAFKWNKNIEK